MNMKRTLLASAIVGMFFSASSVAAGGLGDHYNPYVTADEISASPSMRTRAEERLADHNNPYILSSEIVVTKACVNPAMKLIADSFNPFVTFAQLETAERNKKC